MQFLVMVLVVFLLLVIQHQVYRWVRNLLLSTYTIGIPPRNSEEMFEHNLRSYVLVSNSQAAQYIRDWILNEYLCVGQQARPDDIKRLRELGGIVPADKEARNFRSDARWEMTGFPRMQVVFRADLTLAGIKSFDYDIEVRVKDVAKRKKLTESDVAYFRRFQVLSGVKPRNGLYGGPGFPFPDERFELRAPLSGDQLYFDQNYDLIVHMNRPIEPGIPHKYFWERLGARRVEMYDEAQMVNA